MTNPLAIFQPTLELSYPWAPAAVTGVIALLGWAVTWGGIRRDVAAHEKRLDDHSKRLNDHEGRISYIEGAGGGS